MANQRRIPPENLQGHRDVIVLQPTGLPTGDDGGSGDGPKRVIPRLPFAALKRTKEAYAQFWASEAGMHAKPGDWTEIVTAFENFDEYLRCMNIYKRRRQVLGSQGQMVMNPAEAAAQRWLRLALVVFFRFGFDPRARMQMGIGTANLGRPGPGGPRGLKDDDVEDPDETGSEEPVLIKPRAQRG